MKSVAASACAAALLSVSACAPRAGAGASYVDTRIGTGGAGFGIGSLNPGAQFPFGALKLGPDTTYFDAKWGGQWWFRWNHFGGYYYNDTHIRAFSHTHMVGPGASDWGDVGVMVSRYMNASTIENSAVNNNYRSAFSHDNETATPGYYAVLLEDADTYAELAASGTHSGVHQYTCAGTTTGLPCTVLVDMCHTTIQPPACPSALASWATDTSQPGAVIVSGGLLNRGDLSGRGPLGGVWVYIYAIITATTAAGIPLQAQETALWSNNSLLTPVVTNATTSSGNLGAFVTFAPPAVGDAAVITVRVGISYVSVASAQNNLYVQQGVTAGGAAAWPTFAAVRAAATDTWDAALSRVSVVPPPDMDPADAASNLTMFYSAVYRTLLAPTIYSEANGQFMGMDQRVHVVANGSQRHSDMSIWDIHRTEAPWLAVFQPDVARDMVNSLLAMTAEGGHLPRWPLANVYTGCMDGSHAVAIMADVLLKGITGVNASAVFDVVAAAITTQESFVNYTSLGYVSAEASGTSASSTLEYSYDAGCAAVVAAFVGEGAAAALWTNHSHFYRNLFNAANGYFCPRSADGSWRCPLSPAEPYPIITGFTEGDALQYQTFAPHDQWALAALFASPESYASALDALQTNQTLWPFGNFLPNAWYWAGNEPDILSPWQFPVAGNAYAYLTQYWTRWLLREYYAPAADGVPGNDDFGTMSAWAVWAALGLYPLTGTGMYVLSAPLFANVTVALPPPYTGVALTVTAHNASAANGYVARASINGYPLPTPYVNHSQLLPAAYAPDCAAARRCRTACWRCG